MSENTNYRRDWLDNLKDFALVELNSMNQVKLLKDGVSRRFANHFFHELGAPYDLIMVQKIQFNIQTSLNEWKESTKEEPSS